MFSEIQRIDEAILNFIQSNMRFQLFDFLMPLVTWVGNEGAVWIAVSIIFVLTKKFRRIGIMMGLSLIFCLLVGNLTLKPLIARTRPYDISPDIVLLIPRPNGFSFPSGHTMTSFASAAAIYLNDRRIGLWSLVLAILISFSRLYLYVHFPTDVLAGALIGTANGFVAYVTAKAVLDKHHWVLVDNKN